VIRWDERRESRRFGGGENHSSELRPSWIIKIKRRGGKYGWKGGAVRDPGQKCQKGTVGFQKGSA